jgi:hypothetical protein
MLLRSATQMLLIWCQVHYRSTTRVKHNEVPTRNKLGNIGHDCCNVHNGTSLHTSVVHTHRSYRLHVKWLATELHKPRPAAKLRSAAPTFFSRSRNFRRVEHCAGHLVPNAPRLAIFFPQLKPREASTAQDASAGRSTAAAILPGSGMRLEKPTPNSSVVTTRSRTHHLGHTRQLEDDLRQKPCVNLPSHRSIYSRPPRRSRPRAQSTCPPALLEITTRNRLTSRTFALCTTVPGDTHPPLTTP